MSEGLLQSLHTALQKDGPLAAIQICEQRLLENPGCPDILRQLAQLHAIRGARPAAFRAAHQACKLAQEDPRCWSALGRVHATFGEYGPAIAHFTRALQLNAGFADGWHNLGTALKKTGRNQEALLAFQRAL